MVAFGSGPPYGEATQFYTGVLAGADVEVQLTTLQADASERAKKRYIQGFTVLSDTAQVVRMTGPPATFNGQSIHWQGKRDLTTQNVYFELPVQMLLPDEEDLDFFANAFAAGTVHVMVDFTYQPIPNKPIGYMYSQISAETVTGGTDLPEPLAVRKTEALGQGYQTLLGMQICGEGQNIHQVTLQSALWGQYQEDQFQANNGPWAPGSQLNSESNGVSPILGNWVLSDSRAYTPNVIGDAGDVRLITYWQTAQLPSSANV